MSSSRRVWRQAYKARSGSSEGGVCRVMGHQVICSMEEVALHKLIFESFNTANDHRTIHVLAYLLAWGMKFLALKYAHMKDLISEDKYDLIESISRGGIMI